MTTEQVGTSNAIQGTCSLFVPGPSRLVQGQWLKAVAMLVPAIVLSIVRPIWRTHRWPISGAVLYKPVT